MLVALGRCKNGGNVRGVLSRMAILALHIVPCDELLRFDLTLGTEIE